MTRPASPQRFQLPSREDIATRIQALLVDSSPSARDKASEWASEFVVFDDPAVYPVVDDPVVWEAIVKLSGVDLPTTDREFLLGPEDFREWLTAVRTASGSEPESRS